MKKFFFFLSLALFVTYQSNAQDSLATIFFYKMGKASQPFETYVAFHGDRALGRVRQGKFFNYRFKPGIQTFIASNAAGAGSVTVTAEPGVWYFIKCDLVNGKPSFVLVDTKTAENDIYQLNSELSSQIALHRTPTITPGQTATVPDDSKKPIAGLRFGVNSSIFSTSINSTTSALVGFNLGFFVKVPLSDDVFFRPEIYYSSQGEKEDYRSSPTGPSVGTATTTMNYINVPILLEFGKKVSFQLGPQVGFLLSGKQVGTISGKAVDVDLKDATSGVDFGAVVGLSVSPSRQFSFGIRYNYGFTDIFTADNKTSNPYPTIANRVAQAYLAIGF